MNPPGAVEGATSRKPGSRILSAGDDLLRTPRQGDRAARAYRLDYAVAKKNRGVGNFVAVREGAGNIARG